MCGLWCVDARFVFAVLFVCLFGVVFLVNCVRVSLVIDCVMLYGAWFVCDVLCFVCAAVVCLRVLVVIYCALLLCWFLCGCMFPPMFVCVVFQCLCVVCALLCDDVLFVSY